MCTHTSSSTHTSSLPVPTAAHLSSFHSRFFSNHSYFILPPPLIDQKMYTPKEAIHVIKNCSDKLTRMLLDMPMKKGKYVKRRMSQFLIIQPLIKKKYIPINKTQMYALVAIAKRDMSLIPDWWAEVSKNGQKPHLKPETLDKLTDHFHIVTDGGNSLSKKLYFLLFQII